MPSPLRESKGREPHIARYDHPDRPDRHRSRLLRDARGLRKRNHDVVIYTQQDGPTADQLRAEGFQVTTDLASLTFVPDVIQANQTFPLLEAIGHFPAAPAISICHDSSTWHSDRSTCL